MGERRARRRRLGDDRGASAVEFAIIAPLFFVLVFGIINFGVILGQQVALNHAVREGARAAVVESSGRSLQTEEAMANEVRGNAQTIALTASEVKVPNPSNCPTEGYGSDLVVSASYQSSFLVPGLIPGLSAPNLSAQASFRCERE